ncbi:hypothetical protein HZC53_00395 [Candidatus Uhrbacteria bacterium]|nr:hypothetical protein [Candidatus Uhrbacteria bacterium]
MKTEYMQKALVDEMKARIDGKTPVGAFKKAAKQAVELCERYPSHIPNEKVIDLLNENPAFSGFLMKKIKDEEAEGEDAAINELRKTIRAKKI